MCAAYIYIYILVPTKYVCYLSMVIPTKYIYYLYIIIPTKYVWYLYIIISTKYVLSLCIIIPMKIYIYIYTRDNEHSECAHTLKNYDIHNLYILFGMFNWLKFTNW